MCVTKYCPEIHFVDLDYQGIYYIFEKCCIISVLFSETCHLFHNVYLFVFYNIFNLRYAA